MCVLHDLRSACQAPHGACLCFCGVSAWAPDAQTDVRVDSGGGLSGFLLCTMVSPSAAVPSMQCAAMHMMWEVQSSTSTADSAGGQHRATFRVAPEHALLLLGLRTAAGARFDSLIAVSGTTLLAFTGIARVGNDHTGEYVCTHGLCAYSAHVSTLPHWRAANALLGYMSG